MMRTLYAESHSFNPYYNLAAEELMMENMRREPDAVLLYLWQNERSVVIGRNQDPFVECDVDRMHQDGVHVVRRKSGGGAVYHDLGNLNYTFIAPEPLADKGKWNRIVCCAVGRYGLEASVSGRNDLVIDGKKFSGSAFQKKEGIVLQHGTLMVDVDLDAVRSYLRPSRSKLQKHGIRSVEQRVRNLRSMDDAVSIEGLKENMREEFRIAYPSEGLIRLTIETWTDRDMLERKRKEYASEEFLYGMAAGGGSSDAL